MITAPFNRVGRSADAASVRDQAAAGETSQATLWALLGNRAGDNAMIEAVVGASGLPARLLRPRFNALGALQTLRRGGSLFTLDAVSRALVAPPWPDIVVTSGKRAVPAALWIRRASGGRAKLVHLGRPQAPLGWFDLVITTPQYDLPLRRNVMLCRLPATAAAALRATASIDLADLPRPRIVAILGGPTGPKRFDATTAREVARATLKRAGETGGSALLVTSPRTPASAVAALKEALARAEVPVRLSVFGDGVNLYRDFLAAGDAFLVTDDSVSMVVEAAETGRPVSLFRLPERPGPGLRACRAAQRFRWSSAALDALVGRGLVRSNSDIGAYVRALERDGLLSGGESLRRLAADELADAGRAVRRLASR